MKDDELLEGENPDILQEAREVAGEDWLHQENVRLGGISPVEAVKAGRESLLRDVVRSIKYGSLS